MPESAVGQLILFILVVLASAHLFGSLFTRLRQPRVIGEILGGLLAGTSLLDLSAGSESALAKPALDVLYWIGLLMLMFLSGAETQGLFRREERKPIAWIGVVGTALPFVIALLLSTRLDLSSLMGTAQNRIALVLVLGIGTAVTSIPVISRIFHDLRILHTRFARLILGVAVMEDVALWAVLAVATALAQSATVPHREIMLNVSATLLYFSLGLLAAPTLLKRVSRARLNVLATGAPIAYVIAVLLAYAALAALLDVSLVFAAFLAGLAVMKDERLNDAVHTISRISFAIFIPIYFAVVGYKLDLSQSF